MAHKIEIRVWDLNNRIGGSITKTKPTLVLVPADYDNGFEAIALYLQQLFTPKPKGIRWWVVLFIDDKPLCRIEQPRLPGWVKGEE